MKTLICQLLAVIFSFPLSLYAQWEQNGAAIFYNTGKVAVGTNSPTGILHITGDYNPNDASLTGLGGFVVVGNTNSTNLALDNNEIMARNNGTASDLGLQADGGMITIHGDSTIADAQKVRIANDGSVGIGILTIPTGYKLAVDGKVIAEEIRVENSGAWPDYVFAPGYPLLSIPELEREIRQNGHLPGMPAAAEVATNGIELGDMNRRLLEKVEELTLYLIELTKETETLKTENAALAGRVKTLENATQKQKNP